MVSLTYNTVSMYFNKKSLTGKKKKESSSQEHTPREGPQGISGGGLSRRFHATGWPTLPGDPWGNCASRVSECGSSFSTGVQGDYSWFLCGLSHGKTWNKKTSFSVDRLQTSQVRQLLGSAYLGASIMTSSGLLSKWGHFLRSSSVSASSETFSWG